MVVKRVISLNVSIVALHIKAAWLTLRDNLSDCHPSVSLFKQYINSHIKFNESCLIYILGYLLFCNSINGILSNIFYTDSNFSL